MLPGRETKPLESPVEVVHDAGKSSIHVDFDLLTGILRINLDTQGPVNSEAAVTVGTVTITPVSPVTVEAVTETETVTVVRIAVSLVISVGGGGKRKRRRDGRGCRQDQNLHFLSHWMSSSRM